MEAIKTILTKYKFSQDSILFGDYIAKVNPVLSGEKGKLVLVTATSPTPAGEGKTTTSIGLIDALNKIGKKAVGALREPSMGPVFGVKGGANGGGKSQIVPEEELNLNFTGDMHAITAANNLISSCIDNAMYFNTIDIDPEQIIFKRCMDMNDRSLREIIVKVSKTISYKTSFNITAASEVMASFCMANDFEDMLDRIDNIIIAYSKENKPVYCKQLKIKGAIRKILRYAAMPNVIQTLEGNISLIHGGPFANIAHGCNSIIATKTAMHISDYTVTEAGFASDLGAEKFLDIVCPTAGISPSAIVLVTTIRSLKMHGGVSKEELGTENIKALEIGIENLKQHIKNISNYGVPFVISINKFANDNVNEVDFLTSWLESNNYKYALSTNYADGGDGAKELAEIVVELCNQESSFKTVYEISESLEDKINKVATKCYGASGVEFSELAKDKLEKYNSMKMYVCIAKTPLSLTDDAKIQVVDKPFKIHIQDLIITNGAGFIVAMSGDIFRMPGLPKTPSACSM